MQYLSDLTVELINNILNLLDSTVELVQILNVYLIQQFIQAKVIMVE